MDFRRKNLKVRTRYNILNFPALFSAGGVDRMAGLTVLKKGGKIQNVVSSYVKLNSIY